ncbi:unnamed protein product, partial [Sphacelaria rigidula]
TCTQRSITHTFSRRCIDKVCFPPSGVICSNVHLETTHAQKRKTHITMSENTCKVPLFRGRGHFKSSHVLISHSHTVTFLACGVVQSCVVHFMMTEISFIRFCGA